MKRRNAVILAVVIAVAFGVLYFFYGGHAAPAGQKSLTELSVSQLQDFRADFNQSASEPRMVVMLSPT